MLRLQIGLALCVLVGGQILCWRRRDNVLGYVQGGLLLSTFLLPLLGTGVIERYSDTIVELYARILMVGAAGYLAGLCLGAPFGNRNPGNPALTFIRPMESGSMLRLIVVRTRILAAIGLVSLAGAYAILGYVPLLAADKVSAKYGAGPYAAAFARGAIPYNFALAVASSALPVVLALLFKRRRLLDLSLAAGLLLGLAMSLSRTMAFSGVLLFFVAFAYERRIRPFLILAAVSGAFIAGALVNEIFFPAPGATLGNLANRVAISAPDVPEHLGFLRGFELRGEPRRGWALVGGLAFGRNDVDPAAFTLRTITGFDNVQSYPSGGLRLPAPIWGYASYGLIGAFMWSMITGFFTGWGTARLRNLLERVKDRPSSSVNLVVASVFYTGTFAVFSTFYFATSSMFVRFAIAIYLGRLLIGTRKFEELLAVESSPRGSRPTRLQPGFVSFEDGRRA